MIDSIKRKLRLIVASSLMLVPLMVPAAVAAQDCLDGGDGGIGNCLQSGAEKTDPGSTGTENAGERVNEIIKLVINVFSLIVGVVSVIMIIIGGLKYITSGGEGSNITGAKNTILYAIIGLVVVALAQVIVQFVLEKTISNV